MRSRPSSSIFISKDRNLQNSDERHEGICLLLTKLMRPPEQSRSKFREKRWLARGVAFLHFEILIWSQDSGQRWPLGHRVKISGFPSFNPQSRCFASALVKLMDLRWTRRTETRSHQETVRSNESKGNLQNKRVKRSLDFELPLNIIASPESKDNGLSDSKNCHFAPMKCLLLKWSTVEIKVSMSLSFRRLSLPLDVMIQTISPSWVHTSARILTAF